MVGLFPLTSYIKMAILDNLNDNIENIDIYDMTWDDPATPIEPVIAPNGWHWYPDSNGNLCSHYIDQDGNDSTVWMQNNDGSFYWRCANVGYTCRDIGIEGRREIFFENLFVGTMIMDNQLSVTWLPETYIHTHDQINNINITINEMNDINDIYDTDETDETEDDYDP